MRTEDITLEVRSEALGRLGQISDEYWTDVKLIKIFRGVGSWSLSLPADLPLAIELAKPGRGIIAVGPANRVLLSGPMINFTKETTRTNTIGKLYFNGVDDNIHLSDGKAWPQPSNPDVATQTEAYDVRTGLCENVMRGYVGANIVPGIAPADRAVPGLALQPSQGRGLVVTGRARFDSLGTVLSDLAVAGGLGFEIVQIGLTKQLQIYEPRDLSKKIRMDVYNDLLDSSKYGAGAPTMTRSLVAGQGEGADRNIVKVTTPESLASEAEWGRKIEYFRDRRDTNVPAELTQAGLDDVVVNGVKSKTLSVTPSDEMTMVYGKDWYVGDIVGVVVDQSELSAVVTQAIITMDTKGVRTAATVGDVVGFDFESRMIASQQDLAKRLAFIEKNAEFDSGTVAPHEQPFSTITGTIGGMQLPPRLRSVNPVGPGRNPTEFTESGWYAGYAWAGGFDIGIATLEVVQYSPDWILQRMTSIDPSIQATYVRYRHSGTTWTAWTVQDSGWRSWTPSVSNMTVGSGTVTGRYRRDGKTVELYSRFTLAGGSAIGSNPIFGLPFTAASPGNPISLQTEMLDSGSAYYVGSGLLSSTYITLYYHQSFGANNAQVLGAVSATTPFVWTSGDSVTVRCTYETSDN